MIDYRRVERCQVCSSEQLVDFIDFGLHPSCNCVTDREIQGGEERKYPLALCYCRKCWCVQSRTIVNPSVLFGGDYHHLAGIPLAFRRNAAEFAAKLMARFRLSPSDLIVDIGSNDGTLLDQFRPQGIKVLGVDPSGIAKFAVEKGIPVVNDFFDENTAWKMLRDHGQAKVITATNTFAHVAALHTFIEGVKLLLDAKGAFVTESHYLLSLIEGLQYDFVYHEHLRYYSLGTLQYLFEQHEMDVFDAERLPTHGGSIRVYAGLKGAHSISNRVHRLVSEEKRAGLFNGSTYREFARRAARQRTELRKLISEIKNSGSRLVGLTYPCRGLTLLLYCGIGSNDLEYVSDNTPIKIGKFLPGLHIKVVDQEFLFRDNPDYGLLLSWHLADEIIPKFRSLGFTGKFVVPLPEPRVV